MRTHAEVGKVGNLADQMIKKLKETKPETFLYFLGASAALEIQLVIITGFEVFVNVFLKVIALPITSATF